MAAVQYCCLKPIRLARELYFSGNVKLRISSCVWILKAGIYTAGCLNTTRFQLLHIISYFKHLISRFCSPLLNQTKFSRALLEQESTECQSGVIPLILINDLSNEDHRFTCLKMTIHIYIFIGLIRIFEFERNWNKGSLEKYSFCYLADSKQYSS